MDSNPVAAGKSSFDLIDKAKTFSVLDVKPNSSFLDLACGTGKYSIEVSKIIGKKGTVYAVDLWEEGIQALNSKIEAQNITNIKTIVADISKKIALEDNSIDACLMATIIHDLSKRARDATIREVARVLKPEGILNIIEFKKIDEGPGPPVDIRLQEGEIESIVSIHGFKKVYAGEAGAYNYILKFKRIR